MKVYVYVEYNMLLTKQFFWNEKREKLILKSFNIFFNFQNNFTWEYFVR